MSIQGNGRDMDDAAGLYKQEEGNAALAAAANGRNDDMLAVLRQGKTFVKLPESKAYQMSGIVRGITGGLGILFLVPNMTRLCGSNPDHFLSKQGLDCPSYSIIATLAGIFILAIISPAIGGACDYTNHRKATLVTIQTLLILATGLNIITGKDLWSANVVLYMFMFILTDLHLLACNIYLPELSPHVSDRTRIAGLGVVYATAGSVIYGIIAGGITQKVEALSSHAASMRTQAIMAFLAALPFAYLVTVNFRPRKAAKQLPEGSSTNMMVVGWTSIANTVQLLRKNHPVIGRHVIARCIYNGAVRCQGTLTSIYLVSQVDIDPAPVLLLGLIFILPGALTAMRLGKTVRAQKKLLIITQALMALLALLTPFIFYKKSQKNVGFIYGTITGLTIGSHATLDRALFSHIVPARLEGVMFGIYHFTNNVLEWVPLATALILQEMTDSMRWAPISIAVMMLTGSSILAGTDVVGVEEKVRSQYLDRQLSKEMQQEIRGAGVPTNVAATAPGSAGISAANSAEKLAGDKGQDRGSNGKGVVVVSGSEILSQSAMGSGDHHERALVV